MPIRINTIVFKYLTTLWPTQRVLSWIGGQFNKNKEKHADNLSRPQLTAHLFMFVRPW